jgi:glycosyltransferase involved in cell wall biosynthesis
MIVDVVIPALDEEATLPLVLAAIPRALVRRIYVVDNGSTDATAEVAVAGGAELLSEPRRGYGAACLKALGRLGALEEPPDVVAFLDGDFADDPSELAALLAPISAGADLVIGSRTLGRRQPGALTPQQLVGNRVAGTLIQLLYKQRYSDLGPFRAIRFQSLLALDMRDAGYGWTVEMQVKAARARLRIVEVPVSYRPRSAGRSKVSGTLRGTLGASYKILLTIVRHARVR